MSEVAKRRRLDDDGGGNGNGGGDLYERCEQVELLRKTYDVLYEMISDRSGRKRRMFVAGIHRYLSAAYSVELENERDIELRQQIAWLFERNVRRSDMVGDMLQMYVIYVALVLEKRVVDGICPPQPDPDTDEWDESAVDRLAFTHFCRHSLLPAFENLLDGAVNVAQFTRDLNADYSIVLPGDVVTRPGRPPMPPRARDLIRRRVNDTDVIDTRLGWHKFAAAAAEEEEEQQRNAMK